MSDIASRPLRIGLTPGDTNGIGYEIILKTFTDPMMVELCTPVLYGSPRTATYHRKAIGSETQFQILHSINDVQDGHLNMVSCYDEEVRIDLGQPTAESGRVARICLERAVADLKAGLIDALVTAPICKENIKAEDFPYVGHTEFLQARLCEEGKKALMILTSRELRVAVATAHLPLSEVSRAITPELIEEKVRTLYASLRRDFLLPSPRIAVLGLNPHCGDGGTIGTEERDVIIPTLKRLADEGLPVFGPFAADAFFGLHQHREFDAVLAMYHDQGLIPFKYLAMDEGVNFTAGMPFVRTSPDHGTAFNIAGKGVANATSFREAVYAAIDIVRARRADDEATANPLPKLYHDRREDGERPRRFPREPKDMTPELTDNDEV